MSYPKIFQHFLGSWMYRKYQWQTLGVIDDLLHQRLQFLFLIYIRGTVQGQHQILPFLQPNFVPDGWFLKAWSVLQQRVNHRVAYKKKPLLFHSCLPKPHIGNFCGGKTIVVTTVGNHPTDLLGHGPVAETDPRLYMG